MFRIGDAVIHPAEGVCEITEITKKNFSGTAEEYYVLKSVYDSQSTVYIPVETVKVRPKIRLALSREQVQKIIDSLENNEPESTKGALNTTVLNRNNYESDSGVMKIPGESYKGVYSANEFLTRSNLMKAFREDYEAKTEQEKASYRNAEAVRRSVRKIQGIEGF